MGDVGVLNILAVDATPEASFGTAAAVPDKAWIGRFDRPQILTDKVTNKDSQVGAYGNGTQVRVTGKRMSANPEYDLCLDNLAFFMRAILGTIAAPTGTGPYVHTITETQGNSPSFTWYWKGPKTASGKMERFTGCKVAQLAVSVTAGGKATIRPSILGYHTRTEETVSAPAFSTDSILSGAQLTGFTVNGTDYRAKLTQLDFTIDRVFNPDNQKRMGTTTLLGLDSTDIIVTGSFTIEDDENDLTGIAVADENGTLGAIVATFADGTSGAVITIRKANVTTPGEEGGKGTPMRQVNFEAFYSPSDSETMRAVVTNSTASYA